MVDNMHRLVTYGMVEYPTMSQLLLLPAKTRHSQGWDTLLLLDHLHDQVHRGPHEVVHGGPDRLTHQLSDLLLPPTFRHIMARPLGITLDSNILSSETFSSFFLSFIRS